MVNQVRAYWVRSGATGQRCTKTRANEILFVSVGNTCTTLCTATVKVADFTPYFILCAVPGDLPRNCLFERILTSPGLLYTLFRNHSPATKSLRQAGRAVSGGNCTRLTPNPVARTVTETCLPQRSSTRAPMMMLASGCTCLWMMLAAAFTYFEWRRGQKWARP